MQNEGPFSDNLLSPFSPTHLLGYCKQSEERCRKQMCPLQLTYLGQCAKKPWFPLWREGTGGKPSHGFSASSSHGLSTLQLRGYAHHAKYCWQESQFLKQEQCGRNEPAPSALADSPHLSAHVLPAAFLGLLGSQGGDGAPEEVEGGTEPLLSEWFCNLASPFQSHSLKTEAVFQNSGK